MQHITPKVVLARFTKTEDQMEGALERQRMVQ